uniref:Tetratricopeptide repeat protein n=1 Tax=Meloidogyne incognita TaxID=6306 RepID=A0A914NK58_MELIC
MEEANERYYLLEKESTEINKSDILNILSISLYKQGNLKRALIINDKLIELDPLYPNATNNSKLYEQELLANGVNEEDFRSNIPPLNNTRSSSQTKDYAELCRGEKEIVRYLKWCQPYISHKLILIRVGRRRGFFEKTEPRITEAGKAEIEDEGQILAEVRG